MFNLYSKPMFSIVKINYTFFTFLLFSTSLAVSIYIFYSNSIFKTNDSSNQFSNKINVSKNTKKNINDPILPTCDVFTCVNVYHCGNSGDHLLVYVKNFENSLNLYKNNFTKEFYLILEAIIESKYYTSNPNKACIFVPSLDFVIFDKRDKDIINSIKHSIFLEKEKNFLIFNLLFDDIRQYNNIIDDFEVRAMFAGLGLTKSTYRKGFDISLPVLSTSFENFEENIDKTRNWFILSAQTFIDSDIKRILLEMKQSFPTEVHVCIKLNENTPTIKCADNMTYQYFKSLQNSIFCLVVRGEKLGLSILLEALASQCIPVIVFDSLIMPFAEVLDWSRAAVIIQEKNMSWAVNILKRYSLKRLTELRNHGIWLYERYFKSIKTITETTLDIIADRIFPHSSRNYFFWNEPKHMEITSPMYVPTLVPVNDGFTAVILTYDRIDLLFSLIKRISRVPSLTKILIIWNNEYKKPPELTKWPKIDKSIKVVQTEKNALSNRFYPFSDIETEAILSIDDDIVMLTDDEIEFAFEVWREFPDRIVGFPSRTHTWDNVSFSWKYESEWTNRISMVLTGAAFYHKYWNFIYSTKLPENIKEWIDKHMNCEDIAMNFLVSNITKKAPIKVTAKKKFRCPECINTEMLSADLTHMLERTQCINQFANIFGNMPLKSIEFRADPVLFKDRFPNKLKRFNDIGSL